MNVAGLDLKFKTGWELASSIFENYANIIFATVKISVKSTDLS